MNWFRSLLRKLQTPSIWNGETAIELTANFTQRAKRVFALARRESDQFRHNIIGTEHVLLGLIALGEGIAANALLKVGFNLDVARMKVEEIDGTGPSKKRPLFVPSTPRIRRVISLAQEEAKRLNHTCVGTEHLLLGILAEGGGVAAMALRHAKVNLERARKEILDEITPKTP